MTRVVVADDQALIRAGFRMILDAEPDLEVVGEAATGLEAVGVVARTQPDVVLMDVRMPELDGIEATRRVVASGAPTKVLILTTFDLDDYVHEALRAGASGFLLKESPPEQLVTAVHTVVSGDAVLAPGVTRRMIERFVSSAPPRPPDEVLGSLTPRELEVLGLVARARSNSEIAAELYVSEATVKTHLARLLVKLGLRDRLHAVVFAYENGVVRPGS
ncbi:response regulator transcription factor [Nocardioides sp. HDW12B]|uniref:response regulator n=1 Tax=Nocardioides sp. HDW12B TaxID=2714939 RepID=UPI001407D9C0|nr:response regulator transcription factor [Nocardioides sp. HDW12B]QIK66682.1 response regulator transcription factor [Nocardioides sp. HDW12B]